MIEVTQTSSAQHQRAQNKECTVHPELTQAYIILDRNPSQSRKMMYTKPQRQKVSAMVCVLLWELLTEAYQKFTSPRVIDQIMPDLGVGKSLQIVLQTCGSPFYLLTWYSAVTPHHRAHRVLCSLPTHFQGLLSLQLLLHSPLIMPLPHCSLACEVLCIVSI